jgi:hypothetical protein
MTKAIRIHAGIDLAAAKRFTDAVVEGETVTVEVPGPHDAQVLTEELIELGAIAEVVE